MVSSFTRRLYNRVINRLKWTIHYETIPQINVFELFSAEARAHSEKSLEFFFCIISLLRRELTATHLTRIETENLPENHYMGMALRRKSRNEKHMKIFRDGGESPRSIRFDLKPWSSSVPGRLTPGRRMPQTLQNMKKSCTLHQSWIPCTINFQNRREYVNLQQKPMCGTFEDGGIVMKILRIVCVLKWIQYEKIRKGTSLHIWNQNDICCVWSKLRGLPLQTF